MFSFIKRHWIPYLVGAILALALGFCAAWFIGVKGSTPSDVRAERVAAEKERSKQDKQMFEDTDSASSDATDSSNDATVQGDGGSTDSLNDEISDDGSTSFE